jgi:STAS domain
VPAPERWPLLCDVSAVARPSIGTVDLLCRLALDVRRRGGRLTVTGANPRLVALLTLGGLRDAVGLEPASGLEAGRQTEEGKPAGGVQEEGDAADPVA